MTATQYSVYLLYSGIERLVTHGAITPRRSSALITVAAGIGLTRFKAML